MLRASILVLLVIAVSLLANPTNAGGPTPPPPPFDQAGGFTVLLNGAIYTPNPRPDLYSLVISDRSILAMLNQSATMNFLSAIKSSPIPLKVIDCQGGAIVPGLVDVHVHVTGGGGELGPYSRTPESQVSQLVSAGLTTVVGLLGTDTISRSMPNVLAKLRALSTDGITTYMWTGGYHFPIGSITGGVESDIVTIPEVLGVGELAISDHRSSWPTYQDFVQTVSDLRVGGLISGKVGILHMHMGNAPTMLELAWAMLNKTTIPIKHLYPTHMSGRGPALVDECKKWIAAGGVADFTADDGSNDTSTIDTLVKFRNEGVNLASVSVSSDAYGSLPVFDDKGRLISYDVGRPDATIKTLQNLVLKRGWPMELALPLSTSNPARFLSLTRKGKLEVGSDADILVLDGRTLQPNYVFAMGQVMKTPTWCKHGMFDGIVI